MRAPLAKGLKPVDDLPAVDKTGGDFGGGIIRGTAAVTRGEALGHNLWLDKDFLQSVADAINAKPQGIKSRFTHGDMSGDGLGKYLGRAKNATVDGDTVRVDKHISMSAHNTPDGDLGGYVADLATEDPESFGNSIVFTRDRDAEEAFSVENQVQQGNKSVFLSPDDDNTNHYPHARLKILHAIDAVDDPAANPSGYFHRGAELATEAESVAEFVLGLSDERPATVALGIDGDRAKQFVTRFLERRGLKIVPQSPKEKHAMSKDSQPAEKPAESAPTGGSPQPAPAPAGESKPAETKTEQASGPSEVKRYLAAFGPKGAEWYAEGKSFSDCQQLYVESLKAEVGTLRGEIAKLHEKLGRGETKPVEFTTEQTAAQQEAARLRNAMGSDAAARFAAGIKLPSQK